MALITTVAYFTSQLWSVAIFHPLKYFEIGNRSWIELTRTYYKKFWDNTEIHVLFVYFMFATVEFLFFINTSTGLEKLLKIHVRSKPCVLKWLGKVFLNINLIHHVLFFNISNLVFVQLREKCERILLPVFKMATPSYKIFLRENFIFILDSTKKVSRRRFISI